MKVEPLKIEIQNQLHEFYIKNLHQNFAKEEFDIESD